jgi:radical SAM-linked protein
VQKVRLRYAKRGRLRFTSHRDFARAFERALRRADVPMAYSAGFTPHPKISYIGAAPTGVASEAEFVEIGLATAVEVEALRVAIDEALPPGIDIVEAVEVAATGARSLADRIQASHWSIELPGVAAPAAEQAVAAFLAVDEFPVQRLTKDGHRQLDARAPVVSLCVVPGGDAAVTSSAILDLVVRQVTPAVRPDDVLSALREVAGLAPSAPPLAVRRAQGPIDANGTVGDPLADS